MLHVYRGEKRIEGKPLVLGTGDLDRTGEKMADSRQIVTLPPHPGTSEPVGLPSTLAILILFLGPETHPCTNYMRDDSIRKV